MAAQKKTSFTQRTLTLSYLCYQNPDPLQRTPPNTVPPRPLAGLRRPAPGPPPAAPEPTAQPTRTRRHSQPRHAAPAPRRGLCHDSPDTLPPRQRKRFSNENSSLNVKKSRFNNGKTRIKTESPVTYCFSKPRRQ